MKRIIYSFILLTILSQQSNAQKYVQTVKGRVIDTESHVPVSFASVVLVQDDNQEGTITDDMGNFTFDAVPVGRAMIEIRFVGYEPRVLSNLMVTTGKQLIVNVELTESIVDIDAVTIKASDNKEKPLNTFAATSARTFSIEESQRYAGAGNDVSRMAMNFAGVKASNETVNEIVIRGNSPVGLLFRLNGIDIPNPNHFGDGGTSGGVISMLNNNVLSNSDFLTGAFPAEYGNTISGVFDLRMRNGNNEKHEFLGQVGIMGSEFGAEGPIFSNGNASYLVNYRYSTTKLMTTLIDVGLGSAIPNYQDVSVKLNFPTKKFGNFSLIGFGGKSSIALLDSERDTTVEKAGMTDILNYETDSYNDNYSGVLGLTHAYILGNSAYTRLIVSATTIRNKNIQDSLSMLTRIPVLQYASDFQRTKYAAKFYFNKKVNSKNSFRTGISVEKQYFNLTDSVHYEGIYRIIRNFNGNGLLLQPYAQYQHKLNNHVEMNAGLASLYQTISSNYAVEPRLSVQWEPTQGNCFSLGYGLHSMATPVEILNQTVRNQRGSYIQPNKTLDFTKSHHFVAGYDKIFQRNIRLKTELYYQLITNAGIEKESSSFSLLNRGSTTFTDAVNLKNGGKGYNYGMELTLEKFMERGMYFLSTLSLYESKYRGSDGILRNTAFNSNYVFNLLGGKEFSLGKNNKDQKFLKKLTVDAKYNIAGGQRYSPINLKASREAGITTYDDSRAFSEQLPYYMNIDLRLAVKFIGKNATQEFAIDISNLTNRKNPLFRTYDDDINVVKTIYQFGIMPDILYRIMF